MKDNHLVLIEQEKIDKILQILESLQNRKHEENKAGMDLKLYTIKETGELLGVSESTVKNLMRDGRIDFIKDQGVVRFTYDQIKDYQESKTLRKFKH